MKNLLRNHRAYLGGAIDRCPDLGIEWRLYVAEKLRKRWGVIPYNPMDKALLNPIADEHEGRDRRKKWKADGEYDLLKNFIKEIRHVDLRMTDRSDFGIFYIDIDVHNCGTYEELAWMNRGKKPCLIMCKQGVKNIPDWLFGVLPYENFFSTWESLFDYLDEVDSGQADDLGRWIFFTE